MNRAPLAMIAVLTVLLLGGLGVLGYQHYATASNDGLPQIGGPFTLVDGVGKTVTDTDFRGKIMMIYFGYTHCPDACPTALNDMALALGKLSPEQRQRVAPIFITVDPERDTEAVMADYTSSFGPEFIGLTGSAEAIAQAKREFRVYAAKHPTKDGDYDMDHSSIIYVMDTSGRFISNFTHESDPEAMAKKLGSLLT
jgi:protein SCO1